MSNSAHDRIIKSLGVTDTERLLVDLCDRTFLKLWSYPNPYNDDRKELCDLIAVFGNHVFLFFDRESRKFERDDGDVCTTWQRWKREAIDRQIRTARGAARYIISGRDVYLDSKMRVPLPLSISPTPTIYKLIIAHGAHEACERFSSDNIYGSLAIFYGTPPKLPSFPFLVHLDKEEPVHVFDSHNIHILFRELDTFYDFMSYIHEKERAIATYDALAYTGEEDLLAHFFRNYDIKNKRYTIGVGDHGANALMIGEGEWKSFFCREQRIFAPQDC